MYILVKGFQRHSNHLPQLFDLKNKIKQQAFQRNYSTALTYYDMLTAVVAKSCVKES